MKIKNRVVVVTGGASGIGAALCRKLAALEPKGLAILDVDGGKASALAEELGALGLAVDVSKEDEVKSSIDEVEATFGPIDIYVANAGIGHLGGVELDNQTWQSTWDVNVMAHVFAARALLPAMIERGEGYLVFTSSAAGMLVNMGTAAYTATKHAALGLAEWLAVTHGPQGIKVSCICPQFVRTPMVEEFDLTPKMRAFVNEGIIEADQVALDIIAGIDREEFLILPHPIVKEFVQAKAHNHQKWLETMMGMNQAFMGAKK